MSALGQKRTWPMRRPVPVPPRRGGRQCAGPLIERGSIDKSPTLMLRTHLVLAPDVGFAAVQKPTFYRERAQVAEGFARRCRDETAKQMFQRVAGRWRELATLAGPRKSRRVSSRPKKRIPR